MADLGETIGRLPGLEDSVELGEVLGHGSWGEVRAGTLGDGSRVAVKCHLATGEPSVTERILREARLLVDLEHPHLTRFRGLFRDRSGNLALAYDLVRGRPLSEVFHARPFEWPRTLRIVSELGEALDFLHERGLLHRDLKTENVMLDEEERVRLLDFGFTRPLDQGQTLTRPGFVLGTPESMAPESFRSERLGPAADLFWGC